MEHIMLISLRTLVGFSLLLFLTRLLGKKQLGQLTFFTYITGIAMGNIAGDMVIHKDIKLIEGCTGLVVWAILTFIVEYISLKSARARVLLDGEPTIVIRKGEFMQKEMAKHRFNIDDLTMLLRTNNVFSVKDVDYAILEPNGQLSVLKKPELESVTKKDMQITNVPPLFLPTELIVDGKVVQKNLQELNLTFEWLERELKKVGIFSTSNVFYAEIQSGGELHIEKKATCFINK